jgi:Putative Ig domain
MGKLILITLLSLGIILSGCKGKDEKQTVAGLSPTEQQEKVEPSPSSGSPTKAAESVSPEVIADAPPKITSLKISPEVPVIGDKIKALVETDDKEGNDVMLTFHWSINGLESASTSDTLSGGFKRGDKISLTVIPDDGKRTGNPKSLTIIIGDALPSIQPSPESHSFNGNEYSYHVKAVDADGDTLTYSLKSGPPGMTIKPLTGLIKWNVPPDFSGKFPYTVSVSDGHGGAVGQTFSVDIRREQKR